MVDFRGGLRAVGEGLTAFTTGTPLPQVRQGLEEARQKTEEGRIELQGTRDTARLQSIAQGAEQLKQVQDPQRKLEFLYNVEKSLNKEGFLLMTPTKLLP